MEVKPIAKKKYIVKMSSSWSCGAIEESPPLLTVTSSPDFQPKYPQELLDMRSMSNWSEIDNNNLYLFFEFQFVVYPVISPLTLGNKR